MSDLVGRTFRHYLEVEKICEGGLGEFFGAHYERLDREMAVKVPDEEPVHNADRLSRFERHATPVAKPVHPNILTVHESESDKCPST